MYIQILKQSMFLYLFLIAISLQIQRLEAKIESQNEALMRALRELSSKLNEETERRVQMQADLDKLSNFVTQV